MIWRQRGKHCLVCGAFLRPGHEESHEHGPAYLIPAIAIIEAEVPGTEPVHILMDGKER